MDDEELHNPVTLNFVYPDGESRDLDRYTFLQLLWYGRRRGFSLTKVKKSLSMVTQ